MFASVLDTLVWMSNEHQYIGAGIATLIWLVMIWAAVRLKLTKPH